MARIAAVRAPRVEQRAEVEPRRVVVVRMQHERVAGERGQLIDERKLVAAAAARADDKETQAVIDKAIKARGGADKLAKFKAAAWKGKGKFYGLGDAIDYTGEWAIVPPAKSRNTLDLDFGGMKIQRVGVFNGDKGWIKLNDMLQDMDKDQLAEARDQNYVGFVTSLVPLKDKKILLGVLDLADPDVETPETVAARIRRALPHVSAANIILAPDCGMKYLPRETALGKLKAMVAGAAIMRAELSRAA